MKQITFLSLILIIFTAKIQAQNHHNVARAVDTTHSYFGVVYKDAFRWVDTIIRPQAETLYRPQVKYTPTLLTGIPDRYKMIAELQADKPGAVRESKYLV